MSVPPMIAIRQRVLKGLSHESEMGYGWCGWIVNTAIGRKPQILFKTIHGLKL
jgi:hypothetical protein